MRLSALSLGAAVLVLVTGCGGDHAQSFETPGDLAEAIGCSDVEFVDPQLYADTGFVCDADGSTVTGWWFVSGEDLDMWQQTGEWVVEEVGGPWPRLVGGRWALEASPSTLRAAQVRVGGTLHS